MYDWRARTFQIPKQSLEAKQMGNWMDLAMLLCASAGSMAFSLLLAYAILRAGFAFIRTQPRPLVKPQPEAARLS
jgi:hypothetical protein